MRAVDTNVVLRRVMEDDPQQAKKARALLDEGPVWVSLVVLKEVSFVLKRGYKMDPASIASILEGLVDSDRVVLEDVLVVGAAIDRFRKKPSLGFFDCLVLELARARGHLPLVTFDRALAKQEGAMGL